MGTVITILAVVVAVFALKFPSADTATDLDRDVPKSAKHTERHTEMYEPPSPKMKDTPKGSSKGISPTALMLREEAEPELKALLKPRGPPLTVQRVSPKIDSQTRQMVKGRKAQDFATLIAKN
jgi:hypothetical protein